MATTTTNEDSGGEVSIINGNQECDKQEQQRLLATALGLLEPDPASSREHVGDDACGTATTTTTAAVSPLSSVWAKMHPLIELPKQGWESQLASKSCNGQRLPSSSFVFPVSSFPPLANFDVTIQCHAIIVSKQQTHKILKRLNNKGVMIKHRPRLRVVFDITDNELAIAVRNEVTTTSAEAAAAAAELRKIVLKYPVIPDRKTDSENDHTSEEEEKKMKSYVQSLLVDKKLDLPYDSKSNSTSLSGQILKIVGWTTHTISLSYEDWTADEVLKRLLPNTCEIPSSMEQIGHIAHLNLRDELLPYKYIIGKVLLDKNSGRLKTIVNKVGTIETEYRTFGMEVIAGDSEDGWSEVVVKEEGYSYSLDFQRVYWNSRLGREHRRIVQLIRQDHKSKIFRQATTTSSNKAKEQDENSTATLRTGSLSPQIRTIVADMMAGIGPFAIPLTATTKPSQRDKRMKNEELPHPESGKDKNKISDRKDQNDGIVVYANDLNPESFKYLVINADKNHCDTTNKKLHTFNMDARQFCHKLQDEGIDVDHFIMNLPKTALEFLDSFRGYNVNTVASTLSTETGKDSCIDDVWPMKVRSLPRIHVHCFASKDPVESKKEIWSRCETALGCPLDETDDEVMITEVRDIAPTKNMYCVSFRLPSEVQTLPRIVLGNNTESPNKIDETAVSSSSSPERKRTKLSL